MDAKENLRGGRGRLSLFLKGAALALFVFVILRVFRDPQATADPRAEPVLEVDLQRLDALLAGAQKRILPNQERQYDDVLAYWWNSNQDLFSRLIQLVGDPALEPGAAAFTCVVAPGGGGEHVQRLMQFQGGPRVRRVDVGDRLRRNLYLRRVLDVEDKAGLTTLDGRVLERLPAFRVPDDLDGTSLVALVQGSEEEPAVPTDAVVLLEGLESIHPQSSTAILRLIASRAGEGAGLTRAHFVVLGTTDAFAPWLRTLPLTEHPGFAHLAAPRVSTAGDLGYLAQASLALDRSRWPEEQEIESFQGLVLRHGFLRTSLAHVYLWRQVTENAVLFAGRSEDQIQAVLFDKLLDRSRQLGRQAERGGPLARALTEVAARTAGRIDEQGYFQIDGDDTVAVEWDGKRQLLPVRALLEQSGCIALDLRTPGAYRFRFEPLWLHGHLARAWLDEQAREKAAERGDLPLAKGDSRDGGESARVRAILAEDDLPPSDQQLGGPRRPLPRPPR